MSRLRRFLALPAPERHVLLAAALLLPTVRLALSILPFRTMRRLVTRLARARSDAPLARPPSPARVGWAVRTAGRYVPTGGDCLAPALPPPAPPPPRGDPTPPAPPPPPRRGL